MSVDVYVTAPDCCSSHGHQFTYNYTPALSAAGFPSWSMLNELPAKVVFTFVYRVIEVIEKDPDRYGQLIRGGGEWGTVSTLLEHLRELMTDLSRHYDQGRVRCG